ncbi:MAG: pyrroline-5-carboxylate reductase family protein, partial [Endomicrobiia bacterium]
MFELENKILCFLGAGNIAEAIISGLLDSDLTLRKNIIATDIRKERLTYISKKFGIKVETNNVNAVRKSDIIVIAVKPQQIKELLQEISGRVQSSQLVISVAAGITTKYIESFLGKVPVIRTMPNTPVFVKEGMIVYCKGRYVKKEHESIVRELFNSVGLTISLKEKLLD